MKHSKFVAALFALAIGFYALPAHAIKICDETDCYGELKEFNFGEGLSVTKSAGKHTVNANSDAITDNLVFQTNLVAEGRPGASTQVHSSSTNLAPADLPWAIVYKNVGNGGPDEAGIGTALPNGKPGQMLTLQVLSVPTGKTWVVTPVTKTGYSKIVFDTIGDQVTLLYVNSTIGWIISSNSGATITHVHFQGN